MATKAKASQAPKSKLSDSTFITVAVILSILALAVAVVIGRDQVAKVRLNSKVIGKKTEARDTLKDNIVNGRKLVEAHKKLGAKAKQITTSLPNDADMSGLSNILERVASDARLRFKSIQSPIFDAEEQVDPLTPLPTPLEATFEGDYAGLVNFLKGLEATSRPVVIKGVDVSGSTPSLRSVLRMETYYQSKADLSIKMEEVR